MATDPESFIQKQIQNSDNVVELNAAEAPVDISEGALGEMFANEFHKRFVT